jgi:hypothetical protein
MRLPLLHAKAQAAVHQAHVDSPYHSTVYLTTSNLAPTSTFTDNRATAVKTPIVSDDEGPKYRLGK